MKFNAATLLLLCTGVAAALAPRADRHACPLLGQQYPPPKQLSTEPKFQAATAHIDATLNAAIKSTPYKDSTFSIGFFSTSEDDLVYQYHHTGAAVQNSSYGTTNVDADSVYRIGSISKLLTVYLWLIHQGESGFNTPIAEILPQLQQYSKDSWNSITPDWSDITIGDLAGQMGGLSRDCESSHLLNFVAVVDICRRPRRFGSTRKRPCCLAAIFEGSFSSSAAT